MKLTLNSMLVDDTKICVFKIEVIVLNIFEKNGGKKFKKIQKFKKGEISSVNKN